MTDIGNQTEDSGYIHLFSDKELAIACDVLQKLGQNLDVYNSKTLRQLRVSMQPLFEIQKKAMFGGHNPEEYSFKKLRRMRIGQEKLNQRVRDQHFIKQTKLRAGRIKRLELLSSQEGLIGLETIPMILDGAVEEVSNDVSINNSNTEAETPQEQSAPNATLNEARACYICKKRFKLLHHFYDTLCPDCAELNWNKRNLYVDLTGRICLVTGGRVKIGFHCCLKLLRCGATVIATSRFPADTAKRFFEQDDFSIWKDRIHVYGLDLRYLPAVELFCDLVLKKYTRLDAIINNACQTIRRPSAYYAHLMAYESRIYDSYPEPIQQLLSCNQEYEQLQLVGKFLLNSTIMADVTTTAAAITATNSSSYSTVESPSQAMSSGKNNGVDGCQEVFIGGSVSGNSLFMHPMSELDRASTASDVASSSSAAATPIQISLTSAELSQVPMVPEDVASEAQRHLFPAAVRDGNNQQIDLRSRNSWLLCMHEVSTPELVEVFTINSISPFVLVARLKPLMLVGQSHRSTSSFDTSNTMHTHTPVSSVSMDLQKPADSVAMAAAGGAPALIPDAQTGASSSTSMSAVRTNGVGGVGGRVQSLASTIISLNGLEELSEETVSNRTKSSRKVNQSKSEGDGDGEGEGEAGVRCEGVHELQLQVKRRREESHAWKGGEAYKGHGPGAASTVHGANADRVPASDCRFVVNVSSMEGKFYRRKLATHPHTNMAKAALNMLTRTSAADYQKSGIYMTAVDTGWINDENPLERAARIAVENNFATPLDEIDAAARILDPVLSPLLEASLADDNMCTPAFGCFLKDYFVTEW